MVRRSLGLTIVLTIALAACGSRVVPLSQDFQGNPNDPSFAGTTGGQTTGTATGGQTTGAQTGTATTGGQTTGGTSGFLDTGPRLANCSGGKSDTGVTETTIKLGLIASLTGPLPGQFNSAVEAVDSFYKAVNDAGGICGRRIQLLIRDDNGNGATNLAIAKKMAEEDKIFAFVGSHSAPDDSGIAAMSKKYKIPDIGFPLTWQRTENPYTYGVPGQVRRETIGEGASGSKYLNRVLGIKQIAIFWLRESEVSILSAWAFEAAMKRATKNEIEVCYERPTGVLDSSYNNYVISMKSRCKPANGPIAVYSTMENNANIKLAKAMRAQNFRFTAFAPTFTSYQAKFIKDGGAATEGAYMAMPQIPFERLEQPQSTWTKGTFELQRYVATLKRYYPRHQPPGSFGGPAWGSAFLFAEVAAKCGAALTRACVLRNLDTMGTFTANGFLSPTKPSNHHVYTTDLVVQVRNGKFVEIRPNDKSGPPEAPDFWDQSELFNWQKYFCANDDEFPDAENKKQLIAEC